MDLTTPLVLGVDIGSTNITASVFDATSRCIGSCTVQNIQHVTVDGTNQQLPNEIFNAVENAIDGVLESIGQLAKSISAVSLDSMAGTFIGLDKKGNPITPIYTYADTRSKNYALLLKNVLDHKAAHQRTGTIMHSAYLPARILWLKHTQPELAKSVSKWVDVATMLYNRWFNISNTPCSYAMSAWSGMLNRHKLEWDEALLQVLDISPNDMPSLQEYSQPIYGLSPQFASRWPSLTKKPFFLGVGDGFAANVAAGCTSPKTLALTVGTTGAMRMLIINEENPDPMVPEGLWVYKIDRNISLLGGAFSEGGNLLSWALNNLNLPALNEINDNLLKVKPDQHGLTVLPFLAGERSVGWSSIASGVITGLSLATTPLDILQAMLEAIAYRFIMVLERMPKFKHTADTRIIACGGAICNSPWWMQTMANALGITVETSEESKETVRGTAILALHELGVWKTLNDVKPKVTQTFYPDSNITQMYRESAKRQKLLYEQVISEY